MRLMICVALVLLVASVGIVLAADQAVDANLTTLDKLDAASTPVTVKSPTATLNSVLNLLSTVGGFEVEIRWSPIPGAAPEGPLGKKTFAVDWDKISMKDALTRLATQLPLRYEVPTEKKLVVVLPAS